MGKIVTFGEILLRLAPKEFLRFSQANSFDISYGGAEFNVAVSLANYGLDVDFVSRLPENDIGNCALAEIRKAGVNSNNLVWGGKRLGIYFLEKGADSRGSKVLYDRSNSALAEIKLGMIDWNAVFEGADCFHWSGITPAISKNAADVCLEAVKIASKKGIKVSADFNFRSKLWSYCDSEFRNDIMHQLTSYCDIINGNEYDVKEFFNILPKGTENKIDEKEKFISISKQMMKEFPKIKIIATANRGSISASQNIWQGFMFDGKKFYETKKYEINNIVDRVGTGDAFTAGLIYGIYSYGNNHQEILDFATAASCLKHSIQGDVNLVSLKEVEKLMKGNSSGRIER